MASAAGVNGAVAVPLPIRPLRQRLIFDVMLTILLATVALITIFGLQSRNFSIATGNEVDYAINTAAEPLQQSVVPFSTTIDVYGGKAHMSSDTSYLINAKVESKKAYNDAISPAIPYDLLLAWGEVAEEGVDSKLTWEQANRRGMVSGVLGGARGPDVTDNYVITHVSNNHLVPATEGVRKALESIQPGDLIRIEGWLVDLKLRRDDGRAVSVSTSKSRSDQGEGACEVILVERIKVNNKIYN